MTYRERIVQLEAALDRYGVHLTGCPQTVQRRKLAQDTGTVAAPCECGLAQVRAGEVKMTGGDLVREWIKRNPGRGGMDLLELVEAVRRDEREAVLELLDEISDGDDLCEVLETVRRRIRERGGP